MNNNNKNRHNKKNKTGTETRVFARLISSSEVKTVAGGQVCESSYLKGGKTQIDCIYEDW